MKICLQIALTCILISGCCSPDIPFTITQTPNISTAKPEIKQPPIVIHSSISPNGDWGAETIKWEAGRDIHIIFQIRNLRNEKIAQLEELVYEDKPLANNPIPYVFSWSQNNEYLYYTKRGGGDGCFVPHEYSGDGLVRVNLQTGAEEVILLKKSSWMALSPNQKFLAFVESYELLLLKDLSSGKIRKLTELFNREQSNCPVEDTITRLYWSPDGNQLLATYICGPCGSPTLFSSIASINPINLSSQMLISQSKNSLLPTGWSNSELINLYDQDGQEWVLDITSGELAPLNE